MRARSLAVLGFAALLARGAASGATFTVNTLTDTDDVAPGNGACLDSANECSFRAALQEVAARSGGDTIDFSVSGTIVLSNPMPAVTKPNTTIDGTGQTIVVQGGSLAGLPLNSTGGFVRSIRFTGFSSNHAVSIGSGASGNTLQGLVVGGSPVGGILISGTNNVVVGCLVGTNASGTAPDPNFWGITLASGASGNRIGGTTPLERNIISGNVQFGVYVLSGATGNLVEGNYIGTNILGLSAAGNGIAGIWVDGNGNTIGGPVFGPMGNVIAGNGSYGVAVNAASTIIEGNIIGLGADGATALGNGPQAGVFLTGTASNTLIGGTGRNVISGHAGPGIWVGSAVTTTNIFGNFIGTDATGLLPRGNATGIYAAAPANVGGGGLATRNVVSANGTGIRFSYAGSGSLVRGNLVGVGADGTTPLGNTGVGISVEDTTSFSTIGGLVAGEGNVIAHNGAQGVLLATSTSLPNGIQIVGNSIHDNGALGIDLAPNGVTPNDPGDGDTGPNGLQNFPVITSAIAAGGNTTITGTLNSAAGATFRVELFASPSADPSGYGEGATYLGAVAGDVTTDGSGNATWVFVATGSYSTQAITATATSIAGLGSTSEFSAAYTATPVTLSRFTAE